MSTRIAVCFFGITRSLSHTLASIERNVLEPAAALGELKVYAHLFRQRVIDNPRSGESGLLPQDEHELLPLDWLDLEEPDRCLEQWDFEGLKRHGDTFGDGFRSMRNLVHQLHSIRAVTRQALAEGAGVCVFVRPDMRYHDSLGPAIGAAVRAAERGRAAIWIPYWEGWGGLNDRLAICAGEPAIRVWGERLLLAADYCALNGGQPLHSESLVRHAVAKAGLKPHFIGVRASRIRADGSLVPDNFDSPRITAIKESILPAWRAAKRLPGMGLLRRRFGRGLTDDAKS